MKQLYCLALVLLSLNLSFSQGVVFCESDSTIIRMAEFYKGYGKVFRSTSLANRDFRGNPLPGPITSGYKRDIELEEHELTQVEKILKEQFSVSRNKNLAHLDLKKPILKKQNNLTKHYRQYVGYENEQGDRMVLLLLLNFKRKRIARQRFTLWKEMFAVGSGDWYSRNQYLAKVNLTTNKLILPSDSTSF